MNYSPECQVYCVLTEISPHPRLLVTSSCGNELTVGMLAAERNHRHRRHPCQESQETLRSVESSLCC